MNSVILLGRLVRDPESQGEGDSPRVKFTIAIDRFKEGVDFINCVSFGKQAENIINYCKKGTQVLVEGSLNSYSFETEEGNKVSGMNVNARRVTFLSTPAPKSKSDERTEEQQILDQVINYEVEDDNSGMELPF